ncbi:MAG: hypothetical protein WC154_00235 [Candidatus Izemoplasmatales bacterium]
MFPNSPNIRMNLLTIDVIQDSIGNSSYQFESSKEAIGLKSNVTSREYYEAKKQDIQIEIVAKIQTFLYNNAKYVDVSNVIYKIERTYVSGQFMELYLSRTSIRKSDIIGYS